MRHFISASCVLLWLVVPADAACTPQMLNDMQARGVPPQTIQQLCGGETSSSPNSQATVCATQSGFCALQTKQPRGQTCTCPGPRGAVQGTSQ